MSRLEELLQTLCPDGVEYVTLGDISNIDSSGVDKKIIAGEKDVFLLNYMDVYRNRLIDKSVIRMQVTASDSKIQSCDIQQGDIFLTPTSETIEDLAHSAVAIETIVGAVYSYHIMRLRLKKKSMMTSFYLNYLFRSEYFQNQIQHYASGLTRFGLSRGKWLSLNIPLPPLPVQEEIVRILDTFSDVVAELEQKLEAEQAARTKQYDHYRNELLSFDSKSKIIEELLLDSHAKKFELLSINEVFRTITPPKKLTRDQYKEIGTIPIIDQGQNPIVGYTNDLDASLPKNSYVLFGDHTRIIKFVDFPFAQGADGLKILRPKSNKYLLKYLYYAFLNADVQSRGYSRHWTYARKIKISVPPLEVQEKIVSILDRFDALVNDLKSGLPAEIALRRKQYEYYRDKLLTFTRRA